LIFTRLEKIATKTLTFSLWGGCEYSQFSYSDNLHSTNRKCCELLREILTIQRCYFHVQN